MCTVQVIPASRLAPDLVAAWSDIQRADALYDSPYFRPEFTQAVAAVRNDVEVAVIENSGRPVGFFPFQRGNWSLARPVGGRLSDFHGVIVRSAAEWSPEELLDGCALAAWDFDHLPVTHQPLRPFHQSVGFSPYIDLSRGFDAYQKARRAESDELAHTLRKARKIEREVGPLRFVAHTADRTVFDALIRWKTEQYKSTSVTDVFAFPWTVALLERVLEFQQGSFAGMLSALYVGDRLLAIHLGVRSRHVLHSWFPAYEREFYKYSPGLILLTELARAAPGLGITRIDLGKGDEQYKASFMSGGTPVAEGSLTRRGWVRALRSGWCRTRDWVKASPLRGTARLLRHYCERRQFQ